MKEEEKIDASMLQLERLASEQRPELKRDLSSDIMFSIENESSEEQTHQKEILAVQLSSGIKYLVGSLLMANVALVVALAFVVNSHSSNNTLQKSIAPQIFEGYQTISLNIDSSQAEQLKHSNSHADVLMNLGGSKKLAIAKFLPVLGLKKNSGSTTTNNNTVYLLADEITAKRISLAQEEHSISVSPLETPQQATQAIKPHLVALKDPAGRVITPEISAASTAVLYLSDPETGVEVRHVLRDGRWVKDEIFDVYSF